MKFTVFDIKSDIMLTRLQNSSVVAGRYKIFTKKKEVPK